jgi:hypothetical protein
MAKGSCSCGRIKFEVNGHIPNPDACHCTQCRKHSGHFFVSTDISRAHVTIVGEENITWYYRGDKARRGFCCHCGSPLFWDPLHRDWIGIAMGAFDDPTSAEVKMHIFTSEKGDYYQIPQGAPQYSTTPPR